MLNQHNSDGLDGMGPIRPSLALCVFAVFLLVYFSLWKGVKSAGKVYSDYKIVISNIFCRSAVRI